MGMFEKSSPPPPPDYTGAAVATAAGNADAARIAAKANRVNQYGPYGSITYANGANGDPDQWSMNTTLSPTGQAVFDANQRINMGLSGLAETGLGFVQNTLNKPFDWSAVPKAPVNAGTTAQQAIMSRLEPALQRQRDSLQQRLANTGIGAGTEAYGTEQNLQGQRENDLMLQAAMQGIGMDQQARQQSIQEQEFGRTEPLNILNAVRSSAPVNLPQFQNVPQQATVAGPNYLGAAQAQGQNAMNMYNAEQAQGAGMMNGLFSLGGAAMMGGFNPFSFGGAAASGIPNWAGIGYGMPGMA